MKTAKQRRIKVNMHQITALLLAFLLIAATLSPALVVKADDDWTSAGAGDVAGSSSDDIFVTELEDGSRILSFTQTTKFRYVKAENYVTFQYSYLIQGTGRFVIVSFMDRAHSGGEDGIFYQSYLLSDEAFTTKWKTNGIDYSELPTVSYNGVYYRALLGVSAQAPLGSLEMSNVPNIHSVTLQNGESFEDLLRRYIDSGSIDLTKDNFLSDDAISDMTPVRDESIGYLPGAQLIFANGFTDIPTGQFVSDIYMQWDSSQEKYSDISNPYYVEVYVDCYYNTYDGKSKSARVQYFKYGDFKYIDERFLVSPKSFLLHNWLILECHNDAAELEKLLDTIKDYGIKFYYVRLLHFDYDKQQLLSGGWTRLMPTDYGSNSSTGDYDPNTGDWTPSDDGDGDDYDKDGNEVDPNDPDPDDPDFTIDDSNVFTLLYSLVKATSNFITSTITSFLNAFKSVLSSVGEFPSLLKNLFSFLPDEINYLMFGGVAAVVVMRFLGR